MKPRNAAGTAGLALTVALAVSAAAVPGKAHPIAPVRSPAFRSATDHRVPALVVNVHVGKQHITRSRTGFRPGNTIFNVYFSPARGHAAVQLLRLRQGYTFEEFRADLERDDLSAIRQLDRQVIFYGGMPATPETPGHFGVRLEPGKYWLFDFDTPRWDSLRVEGSPQRRSLPQTTGAIDMVIRHGKHRFATPRSLPNAGWLRQTNRTGEPHFMDMTNVKPSTSRRQVRRALNGQGGSHWAIKDYPGTFLVSPGRSVVWRYSYPPGKYLELCFWPNAEDGTTHAEMGMWNFITLL
jgi:hypothetical protein